MNCRKAGVTMSRDGNRQAKATRRKRNIYAKLLRENREFVQSRMEGKKRAPKRRGNKGNLKRELIDNL